jgi:hypothetical protein
MNTPPAGTLIPVIVVQRRTRLAARLPSRAPTEPAVDGVTKSSVLTSVHPAAPSAFSPTV